MSAQQKLNSMMQNKGKSQADNGDTPGFIDRYLSKKQFVQSAMERKAEASYQELASEEGITKPSFAQKSMKITPSKIAKLDLNEIGDSYESVTALQEQLKEEKKKEEKKTEMKKALAQKLTVKKIPVKKVPQIIAAAQKSSSANETKSAAQGSKTDDASIAQPELSIPEPEAPVQAPAPVQS